MGDYWFHTASLGEEWREMITLTADGFNLFDDRAKTDIDRHLPERNCLVGVAFRCAF